MMSNNIKPGYIGFSNNKTGQLAKLIRFFTKSNISHSFIITNSLFGQDTVQEASMVIQIVPLDKYYRNDNTQSYWLYEIVHPTPQNMLDSSLEYCYKEFAGVKYGYLQLLWFIYRWFWELFGRDVRKEKNWMADGVICSELVYYYLYNLGEPFQSLLKDYNPDTIQAEDLRKIVEKNPQLFNLVEYKI